MTLICRVALAALLSLAPVSALATALQPIRIEQRIGNQPTHCFRQWTAISGFTINLELDAPATVVFSGAVDLHHRGLVDGVIGYAVQLTVSPVAQGAPWPAVAWSTPPGARVPGSVNGGNIPSEAAHYGKAVWTGAVSLPAGRHQIRAYCNSHSSIGGNSIDGLAEVLVEPGNGGLNNLTAIIIPETPVLSGATNR